jgi:hypothetical protein
MRRFSLFAGVLFCLFIFTHKASATPRCPVAFLNDYRKIQTIVPLQRVMLSAAAQILTGSELCAFTFLMDLLKRNLPANTPQNEASREQEFRALYGVGKFLVAANDPDQAGTVFHLLATRTAEFAKSAGHGAGDDHFHDLILVSSALVDTGRGDDGVLFVDRGVAESWKKVRKRSPADHKKHPIFPTMFGLTDFYVKTKQVTKIHALLARLRKERVQVIDGDAADSAWRYLELAQYAKRAGLFEDSKTYLTFAAPHLARMKSGTNRNNLVRFSAALAAKTDPSIQRPMTAPLDNAPVIRSGSDRIAAFRALEALLRGGRYEKAISFHKMLAENPNYETPDVQAGLEIAAACARQKCAWPSLSPDNMLPAMLIALDLPMGSTGASLR